MAGPVCAYDGKEYHWLDTTGRGISDQLAERKMPEQNIPYVTSYGAITKTLERIKQASTPDRFTQDFLSTKLGLKGGSPKPVIPFLKRSGFLASDGTPTDLYRRFRNPSQTGAAAAEALRLGYRSLFEVNEYAQDLSDPELRGLIVQVTGQEGESSTTRAMLGSFKALREFADFEASASEQSPSTTPVAPEDSDGESVDLAPPPPLSLGYTINLNLPATSDIAVFNAIFKSLREHLLR